jgi:chromosome segregation ATPase
MRTSFLLAACLTLLLTVPGSAEFYKYVDENGNIRFTDDITMIPREQREKLKVYEEVKSPPPDTAAGEGPAPEEAVKKSPEEIAAEVTGVTEEELQTMKKRLDDKKAALAEEYNALKEERKALESRRREYRSRGRIKEYEDAVDRLNAKNAAYEAKRKEFEAEVKTYNETNRKYFEAARKAAE